MHIRNATLPAAMLMMALLLVGCGEEAEDADALLPERPADKLVEGSRQPARVVEDPTPQAGTGGAIPGYDPAEATDANEGTPSTSGN